jgi:hypothetical protein
MAQQMGIFLFGRVYRVLRGPCGHSINKSTPAETLNQLPGEILQVKPIDSIFKTLDDTASNRRLWFSPNMRLLCGQQQRVEGSINKPIVDGSGEMRKLRNTVFLKGSHCGCAHIAFAGCSRAEYVYWREIWLCRYGDSAATGGSVDKS